MRKLSYILMLMLLPSFAFAQLGVHRNDFSIGVNGGYNMPVCLRGMYVRNILIPSAPFMAK